MHRTNIKLDGKQAKKPLRLTQTNAKKQGANNAPQELVSKARRKKLLELEGKVKWKGSLEQTRKARP